MNNTFLHRFLVRSAGAAMLLALLAGCSPAGKPVQPIEPTWETSCALDGMTLLDFPGPKAQIQYSTGAPDFFCSTMEMFSIYLQPEQKKQITGIFTQDMGKTDWENPKGNWFDAKKGFYVLDSKKLGAMGPTLGAFARKEDAETFARQHDGKMLQFDQVTIEMVSMSGSVLHDQPM